MRSEQARREAGSPLAARVFRKQNSGSLPSSPKLNVKVMRSGGAPKELQWPSDSRNGSGDGPSPTGGSRASSPRGSNDINSPRSGGEDTGMDLGSWRANYEEKPIHKIVGRWVLGVLLGKGGFGRVYQGESLVTYCVLCTVYCGSYVCCVLCAVCCVLCAVCCVLCAVCCVLFSVYCCVLFYCVLRVLTRYLQGISAEDGSFVAVKQLEVQETTESQATALKREIELLRSLHHRNVVRYIDFVEQKKRGCTSLSLVMEFVENGSLKDQIKRYGVFPEGLTLLYTFQILSAIEYVHTKGIIHGDVKNSNILITKEGVVKLTDFGVAQSIRDKAAILGAGTPFFMSPEVVEGGLRAPSNDIWSVGCCMIELLEGQPPYFSLGEVNSLFRLLRDPHPPLPARCSHETQQFLLQIFVKDPVARPSAHELLHLEVMRKQLAQRIAAKSRPMQHNLVAIQRTLLKYNSGSVQKSGNSDASSSVGGGGTSEALLSSLGAMAKSSKPPGGGTPIDEPSAIPTLTIPLLQSSRSVATLTGAPAAKHISKSKLADAVVATPRSRSFTSLSLDDTNLDTESRGSGRGGGDLVADWRQHVAETAAHFAPLPNLVAALHQEAASYGLDVYGGRGDVYGGRGDVSGGRNSNGNVPDSSPSSHESENSSPRSAGAAPAPGE
jgi:serine/threonine protein kinase